MAANGVCLIPVYQIGSYNKLISPLPTYIGVGVGQINNVMPLSNAPGNVNGALVYSVIYMNGTVQNPGYAYYTSLTVAAVITATG